MNTTRASLLVRLRRPEDPYDVRANILASDEFYSDAGGTPDGFVNLMYAKRGNA